MKSFGILVLVWLLLVSCVLASEESSGERTPVDNNSGGVEAPEKSRNRILLSGISVLRAKAWQECRPGAEEGTFPRQQKPREPREQSSRLPAATAERAARASTPFLVRSAVAADILFPVEYP